MEGADSSNATQNIGELAGKEWPLSSFLTANNAKYGFGTLRIPISFFDNPANTLPLKVIIKCNGFDWKAKINSEKRLIYGLRRFMEFFDFKLYNLVQFDYHGNGIFSVKIFKSTAIECNYQKNFSLDIVNINKKEYNVDVSSIEFEKAYALWTFSAYENCLKYFQVTISNIDLDKMYGNVRLNPEMEDLYHRWEVGKKICVVFLAKTWEITVDSCAGTECFLGNGWNEFAKDSELAVGDTLIMYNIPSRGIYVLNACIIKACDSVENDNEGTDAWKRSFFKILSDTCIVDGVLVLPKSVKDIFDQEIKSIIRLEVAGEGWFINYNSGFGYLWNCKSMMERFHLRQKETIVFKMDKINVLYGRIYGEDGTEIDYESRKVGFPENQVRNWFWDIVWEGNKGSQYMDQHMEKVAKNGTEAGPSDLGKMHFPKSVFAEFIICQKPDQWNNGKMIIPEEIISDQGDKIPLDVFLQFPSGREIHVCFSKEEKSFMRISLFLKEIGKLLGSILVFTYNGEGKFLVNVLNDDATEVQYREIRTNPKCWVVQQDPISGEGFKFLINVIGRTYDAGEVVLPDDFYNRFGRFIPAAVTFVLRNGEVFHGNYHFNDKTMSGIMGMIEQNHVQRKDIIVFKYNGKGFFEIVIFDKTKVEKVLLGLEEQTDMDVDNLIADIQPHNVVEVEPIADVVEHVPENEVHEAHEEQMVEAEQMDQPNLHFTVCLSKSHVDHSSHGVNIPRNIKPNNRDWTAGERVILNTDAGSWSVGIVLHNGIPRFSAGWNQFSKDNKLRRNARLVFTLMEIDEQIGFVIHNA